MSEQRRRVPGPSPSSTGGLNRSVRVGSANASASARLAPDTQSGRPHTVGDVERCGAAHLVLVACPRPGRHQHNVAVEHWQHRIKPLGDGQRLDPGLVCEVRTSPRTAGVRRGRAVVADRRVTTASPDRPCAGTWRRSGRVACSVARQIPTVPSPAVPTQTEARCAPAADAAIVAPAAARWRWTAARAALTRRHGRRPSLLSTPSGFGRLEVLADLAPASAPELPRSRSSSVRIGAPAVSRSVAGRVDTTATSARAPYSTG